MKPKTILLAEDDPIVALDLQQQVMSLGHAVRGPYNMVSAAIDALAADPPELAIIDYRLLDGVADRLICALQQAKIPFAVVTVASGVDLPTQPEPISVFSKPFDMNTLSNWMKHTGNDTLAAPPAE